MALIKVILFTLFLGIVTAKSFTYDEKEEFYQFMNIISRPRTLERYTNGNLKAFSFKDCSTAATKRLEIESLSLSPDPLKIPGNITISFKGQITGNQAVPKPIKAVVEIKKKVFGFWVTIPCIDNIGSCTYEDICEMIGGLVPPGTQCPTGLPSCRCPFRPGAYSVTDMTVSADVNLPPGVEKGDYQVTARLSRMDKELGCVELMLSLA